MRADPLDPPTFDSAAFDRHGPLDRLRYAVDRFLHHPVTDLVVIALIVAAVISVLAEEATRGTAISAFYAQVSDALALVFAVELTARFLVARRKLTFFRHYWLDIIAIFPAWRGLRLLRVLMLLRLFRAGVLLNRRTRFMGGVLRNTLSELTIVATISATMVLVGAMMVHHGSGAVAIDGAGLEPGGLEGALWYAVFTLIGGEPIGGMPTSQWGRILTLGLMLGGLTVFGVFVGTVSATMAALLSQRLEIDVMDLGRLQDHLVICGWNPAGAPMIAELIGPGQPDRDLVVVGEAEHEPAALAHLRAQSERLHYVRADYTQVRVLEELCIDKAAGAVIMTDAHGDRTDADRDARTVLTALTIEKMSKGIFVCAELVDSQHEDLLRMAGVEAVVIRDWYAGAIMGSMGRSRGMAAVISDLLTTTSGNAFHHVKVPRRLDGKTVMELHQLLKEQHGAILVSLERPGHETQVNPPAGQRVEAGDRLVVISTKPVSL